MHKMEKGSKTRAEDIVKENLKARAIKGPKVLQFLHRLNTAVPCTTTLLLFTEVLNAKRRATERRGREAAVQRLEVPHSLIDGIKGRGRNGSRQTSEGRRKRKKNPKGKEKGTIMDQFPEGVQYTCTATYYFGWARASKIEGYTLRDMASRPVL